MLAGDLASWRAPMGYAGILLPLGTVFAYLAALRQAFGVTGEHTRCIAAVLSCQRL